MWMWIRIWITDSCSPHLLRTGVGDRVSRWACVACAWPFRFLASEISLNLWWVSIAYRPKRGFIRSGFCLFVCPMFAANIYGVPFVLGVLCRGKGRVVRPHFSEDRRHQHSGPQLRSLECHSVQQPSKQLFLVWACVQTLMLQ